METGLHQFLIGEIALFQSWGAYYVHHIGLSNQNVWHFEMFIWCFFNFTHWYLFLHKFLQERDKPTTNRWPERLFARRDFWLAPNYSSIMKLSKRKNFIQFFLRPFSFPENVLPPVTLIFFHTSLPFIGSGVQIWK